MAKIKMTTVTPVHVGTGENKQAMLYRFYDDHVDCFDEKDLFMQIPEKKLIDPMFLSQLSSWKNSSPSVYLQNYLKRNVRNIQLKPIYTLAFDNPYEDDPHNLISEQIKSLNKPYIPGSTLKGAIYNAIHYNFLKEHFESDAFDEEDRKFNFDKYLAKLGINTDFMKQVRGCLICRDVFFDNMRLMVPDREKVFFVQKESDTDLNKGLPEFECIDYGQESTDDFIVFNKERIQYLKSQVRNQYEEDYLACLSEKEVTRACNIFMNDLFEEAYELNNKNKFYDAMGLGGSITNLYKETKNANLHYFYLRIGASTDYFSKSISLIIKKKDARLYQRKFKDWFCPVSTRNKNAPKPENMPSTRMKYFDDYVDCYPGLMKFEFLNTL